MRAEASVRFVWCMFLLLACGPGLPDRRLPRSTSVLEIPEPDAVLVVDQTVWLDGEALTTVDELGTGTDGARAVEDALTRRATEIAGRIAADPAAPEFRGALSLELDRDLPSPVLLALVATGARAGFGKPWVVVTDPAGERRGIKVVPPAVAGRAVAAAADRGDVVLGGYANPEVRLDPARGIVVRVYDAAIDPGDGLVLACPATPCTDWPFVELNRLARRIKLDHPRDRAAVLVPGADVSIQTVVSALDATRHDALSGRPGTELLPDAILNAPGVAP